MTGVRGATAAGLLTLVAAAACGRDPDPGDAEIRAWLNGNLCRCTGYHNIVAAVKAGARAMRGE